MPPSLPSVLTNPTPHARSVLWRIEDGEEEGIEARWHAVAGVSVAREEDRDDNGEKE